MYMCVCVFRLLLNKNSPLASPCTFNNSAHSQKEFYPNSPTPAAIIFVLTCHYTLLVKYKLICQFNQPTQEPEGYGFKPVLVPPSLPLQLSNDFHCAVINMRQITLE